MLIKPEWFVWLWCNLAAKESGLECACMNNGNFTVPVSGGGRCPLSEHGHCVAVTFKMTERVEQWICIKFCVKLEHPTAEVMWVIKKAAAMGNWWLAALTRQCASSCITSLAVFLWNIKSLRWLSPLQPRFGALQLLAFPKTKITFEREEISDHRWD